MGYGSALEKHQVNSDCLVSSNLTPAAKIMMKKLFVLWAKALGQKEGSSDREADIIALIRTSIVAVYIITNLFIIAGIIRHW